jgi:hypothetical protein
MVVAAVVIMLDVRSIVTVLWSIDTGAIRETRQVVVDGDGTVDILNVRLIETRYICKTRLEALSESDCDDNTCSNTYLGAHAIR